MEILNQLIFKDKIAVAFGFFDGVHKGHKKVISDCVEYAKQNNIKSAVLTFNEHPCVSVWGVTPQYIITRKQRINKIAKLGVDYLYIINFNRSISEMSPDKFLNHINSIINPQAIFTGFNFMFGKNKSGNTKTLSTFSNNLNYKYFEIPEQKFNGITISSTNIRNFLKKGDIETANALLGYDFGFSSNVFKGQQIGHKIGFPTINLKYPNELIELEYGVYSAIVEINEKKYLSLLNFGFKPTVSNDNEISAEAYILDFDDEIYGQNVTVYPQKYIRQQEKFNSLDELKTQIKKDLNKIKL